MKLSYFMPALKVTDELRSRLPSNNLSVLFSYSGNHLRVRMLTCNSDIFYISFIWHYYSPQIISIAYLRCGENVITYRV